MHAAYAQFIYTEILIAKEIFFNICFVVCLFFLYSCQPEVYGAGARRVRDDGQHGRAEMPGERAGAEGG